MNKPVPIGVMGCLPKLPSNFPIDYPENSGNMVHANAPFRILDSTFFIKDYSYQALGYANFVDFVNKKCSHLIITLANTLKLNDESNDKYQRLFEFLQKIDKPTVVFGLGIQAKGAEIGTATLPPMAIELVKLLSSKAPLLGVRGESTRLVLERLCGISNAYVTGCPSLFSNLDAIFDIQQNLKNPNGRPAFSGTRYFEAGENVLLKEAVQQDSWLIEPVNKFNHQYYLLSAKGESSYEDIPYFMKRFVPKEDPNAHLSLARYFTTRYKLFRGTDEWQQFNKDCVSFSYGTRFHVNMATLISGKPAIWITHDARTRELTEFMKLPSIGIDEAQHLTQQEIFERISYEEFFDHLPKLTSNFNNYLQTNGLPILR